MNTVGHKENAHFKSPFYEGKELIIYRDPSKKRPDMMELVVYTMISNEKYRFYTYTPEGYWTSIHSDGTKTRTWRGSWRADNESDYARCRFDFSLPVLEWEKMDDEQALNWIVEQIQADIDDNEVYSYWIEKK